MALNLVDFIFEGKASHAAAAPEKGISALNGVMMLFNGIAALATGTKVNIKEIKAYDNKLLR